MPTYNLQPATYNLGLPTPDLIVQFVIAALLFIAVVFALLVVRQAIQMMHVLPTPLSPLVRFAVFGYLIFTIFAFTITIGTLF